MNLSGTSRARTDPFSPFKNDDGVLPGAIDLQVDASLAFGDNLFLKEEEEEA